MKWDALGLFEKVHDVFPWDFLPNQQYAVTFQSCTLVATLDQKYAELPQSVRWADSQPVPMMMTSSVSRLCLHMAKA